MYILHHRQAPNEHVAHKTVIPQNWGHGIVRRLPGACERVSDMWSFWRAKIDRRRTGSSAKIQVEHLHVHPGHLEGKEANFRDDFMSPSLIGKGVRWGLDAVQWILRAVFGKVLQRHAAVWKPFQTWHTYLARRRVGIWFQRRNTAREGSARGVGDTVHDRCRRDLGVSGLNREDDDCDNRGLPQIWTTGTAE